MSSTPNPMAAHAEPRGINRRWLYLILAVAFLFVLMPFLFWQSTWFGQPLTDAQMDKNLADRSHPRKAQHALSQIADRLASPDRAMRASVRRWYPQVIALASSGVDELRVTAAWVMGQDTTSEEFHQALLPLLGDPNPMVRRNAALSLVRFRDSLARASIRQILEPYVVPAPRAGVLSMRLKPGDVVNPGTLLGSIKDGGQKTEIRSQVPGTISSWQAPDAATLAAGSPMLSIVPSAEEVWEALRALYLIGEPDDLPVVERYVHGVAGMPEKIREQASLAARAIRARSPSRP